MAHSHGGDEVQLVPKFGRKGRDVSPGGCTKELLITLHPHEPWLIFTPDRQSLLQVWNYEDGNKVASWVIPDVNNVQEAGFIAQRENWIVVRRTKIYEVYESRGSNLRRVTQLQTEIDKKKTWRMAVHQSLPCFMAGFQHKDFFLWHWSGKWEKTRFQGHNDWITALVFHPTEAQIFASASSDDTIKVWNLGKRSVVQTLTHDGIGWIRRMGFCRGAERSLLISSHSEDRNVRVWDYKKGICIAQWKAHNENTRASFFHPYLPFIFTAAGGEIRVWSESSYQQVSSFPSGIGGYGIWNMIPSKMANKLILAGFSEFLVVEVQSQEEDRKQKELKEKESPCVKDAQAASSSMTVVVYETAVVSRKTVTMEELEHKLSGNIKLQFEERIKEEVAMVEQNCKKALEGAMAEHRTKERIQVERVQQLEKEMQAMRTTSEDSKIRIQEVERQAQKEMQTLTRRFEKSIWEMGRTLAEERERAAECRALSDELEHKLAEEVAKRERAEASLTLASHVCDPGTYQLKEYSLKDLQDATDNFDVKRMCGWGDRYGTTFSGKLSDGTLVALKKAKDAHNVMQLKTELLDKMRALRHPHLLTLLGFCYEGSCLVYEDMARGNLKDWIAREEKGTSGFLPWYARFRVMVEVARALSFLHSVPSASGGPVIHRAIKPVNILLSDSFGAKVCGVDQALLDSDSAEEVARGGNALPVSADNDSRYIAPEYLHQCILSEKMDIYAFGITVLEMLTGNLSNALGIVGYAIDDDTMFENALDANAGSWDVDLAHKVATLGLSCASLSRRKRPNMTEPGVGILAVLEGVARKVDLAQSVEDG